MSIVESVIATLTTIAVAIFLALFAYMLKTRFAYNVWAAILRPIAK